MRHCSFYCHCASPSLCPVAGCHTQFSPVPRPLLRHDCPLNSHLAQIEENGVYTCSSTKSCQQTQPSPEAHVSLLLLLLAAAALT
jgi:hypothetical protein